VVRLGWWVEGERGSTFAKVRLFGGVLAASGASIGSRGDREKKPRCFASAVGCRGRDTDFSVPPAQIRTGGFPASGSCLRW
jgi:hypothetical protein